MSGSDSPTVPRTLRRGAADGPARRSRRDGPMVLERYRLRRQLGAGGFGTVWQARDERLEREVAVKIVARERIVGGRFEREARAAARLSHPGIVTLYEAGADDDGAYLVSELVRGATLGELLAAGRLSDHDIVEIGIALCDALAHAHAAGVVHRDVKPSNVLIPEHPSSPSQVAKLTDFGVARVLGGDSLTRTGDVLGTAAYMAPEQAEGREVTAAADLYALALVLYESLTGVNPVRTSTAASRARRLGAHLPPLRRQRRDLPQAIGAGIDLALRPRPRERGRLEDLRAALVAALPETGDEPGTVAPPWRPKPTRQRAAEAPDAWGRDRGDVAMATDEHGEHDEHDERDAPGSPPPSLPARLLAAAATAVLTGWLLVHVMAPWPLAPVAVALLAGALVAALPRVGWLVVTVTLVFALLLEQRAGGALVLAIGALVPTAVLPQAGVAWPLSCGAPLLGAIGLAGAWPAVAARAGSVWRRAALGFTGWLWLLLAEPLTAQNLFLGRPRGAPAPSEWIGSLSVTVHHVLGPLATAGALAPALVWAAAAAVLPWLLAGRSATMDIARVLMWAGLLIAGTAIASAGFTGHGAPRGALTGPALGALVALAPTLAPLARSRWRGSSR